MICDPYPRLMVARDQVNQGAAALLMSVAAARRLGVPEQKWVYLRGHADMVEQPLLERVDLGTSPAAVMAVREALSVAGIGLDDVATFDLYSCFPVPVFNICDGLGLGHRRSAGADHHRWAAVLRRARQQLLDARHRRDGRRNARQARAIRTRRRQRRHHEQVLGGRLLDRARRLGARPKRRAAGRGCRIRQGGRHRSPPTAPQPSRPTPSATTGRRPPASSPARLDSDGSRFLATTEDDDLVALMSEGDPLGARITVRPTENGNRDVSDVADSDFVATRRAEDASIGPEAAEISEARGVCGKTTVVVVTLA